MISQFKSLIYHAASQAGYSITKNKVSAYSELVDVPRYQQHVVTLEGHEFRIADSLSFRHSYSEIFQRRIYEFTCKKRNPTIVDCGSNYGTSIVYFKMRYPDAVLTAVECDPEIYKLLTWNIQQRGYHNLQILNKAVSTSSEPVTFSCEGADAGRVGDHEGCKELIRVETVSLDSLIDRPTDFLKMDIEGEETSVICDSKNLHNVTNMFIEYHSFATQPQTLSCLLAKLTESKFRYYIQTQFCAPRPLHQREDYFGMDLQLNIFLTRD